MTFWSHFLAHDLQSSSRTTCYLVERCHHSLWYAPGCSLWCLPCPPNHSAQDDPRRHHCTLATGIVRVRLYALSLRDIAIASYSPLQRITIGYHRLYSHRSFKASLGIRAVLALAGASAIQGSIKVKHVFCPICAKCGLICY